VASSESDLKAITASMQTATSSMRSLSADEKSGDTAAETQMVNNIYSDIKNTISNMNKDTLGECTLGVSLVGSFLTLNQQQAHLPKSPRTSSQEWRI
jgi:hypothetical protein